MNEPSHLPRYESVLTPFVVDEAAHKAASWVHRIQDELTAANADLHQVADQYRALTVEQLAGFYAEAHHAATFNIRAAVNKSTEVAERLGSTLPGSPDIRTSSGTHYSLKYHRTPEQTFLQQARTHRDAPQTDPSAYHGTERLVPTDQLDSARDFGERIVARKADVEPAKAARYQEAHDHLSDRVRSDGVESMPLTKGDADHWAREAKRGRMREITYSESVTLSAHLKEIGSAAGQAALLNVTIQAAPVVIGGIVRILQDPSYTKRDLGRDIATWGKDRGLALAGDTFVKSALAASLSIAAKTGHLPSPLAQCGPSVHAAIVVTSVEAAKNLWLYSKGQCTGEQAASEVFKAGLRTGAALTGKAVGQAIIPIPVVGAVIGSFIAGYVVDKGIHSVENSQTVVLLRVCDQHFAAYKDTLQGLFVVTTHYASLYDQYRAALGGNKIILKQKEEHRNVQADIRTDLERLISEQPIIVGQLQQRRQILDEITRMGR